MNVRKEQDEKWCNNKGHAGIKGQRKLELELVSFQ